MIALFIFAADMMVYLSTIAPTISFFDSGEMISGAYTLGVSHPPGYPVYVTLGKLFSFMPFGNVAFRVNLMSSFFAAMTSVMVYYITRAMFEEPGGGKRYLKVEALRLPGLTAAQAGGIFSAFAFSLSYNLWAWAVVSKFYTLNAFMVSCILMLLIRWRRARLEEGDRGGGHSLSYLYVISFVCGIAGVVHISQFVLLPVYILYILIVDGSAVLGVPACKRLVREIPTYIILAVLAAVVGVVLTNRESPWANATGGAAFAALFVYLCMRGAVRFKVVIMMAFFFLLGHSVVLHIPVRAAQDPLINWGYAVDWRQFKWVYNREGYPMVGGERTWGLFWEQLKSFNLVREFTWAGIPLILGGLAGHFRRDWRHFFVLLFGSVFMTSVIVVMGNPPLENIFLLEQFYIPVYIFLCVIMGGFAYLVMAGRATGAWIIGLCLPFIFLGDVPMNYLGSLFGYGAKDLEKTALMGAAYPSALYFAFYAAMAAAFIFGLLRLQRTHKGGPSPVWLALFLVLFVLYPANQLKAHYWKNDRSRNFIAYDMGNAELTFSPEFAVLYTWGDSGAFPMWYLQDVEKKRPDVLLVHTPHLPLDWFLRSIRREPGQLGDPEQMKDYRLLRNYNGIKGIEQLLSVPEDFRDPAVMIKEIVRMNPERGHTFDYSSRYSVDMPFDVFPYGITYRGFTKDYVEDNLKIWRYLVTRGLPEPRISLDLDEGKAVSIYGYVHADIGKKYQDMGLGPLSDEEFTKAVKFAPELWSSLMPYMK